MNMMTGSSIKHRGAHRGFSLIEVLVSLSIFTVVVTVSVSALLVLIDANARAQNMQSVMVNLSFALDSMTREIRTGSYYYCGSVASLPVSGESTSNCGGSGGTAFAFQEGGRSLTGDASSRWIGYRLNNGALERRLGNGDGDSNVNEASDWIAVTTPDINIETLQFYTTGSTKGDATPPSVTLYLSGSAGTSESTRTEFDVQTTVVQQLIDI